ncbi:LOW QUALITY PROTEIN: mediator of DNA damage checkpoint protein 1-like [Gigantopelta aegis]|uniref:LOW QUALITY PROTEIN: mediator of DNA damage checkpoint protein 1-like n=1 Tax=Gigantopelta aegis TaxID=1735272 RepID=UPI001B88A500|nr:LOW QUALITY PROTEIN: mediator of DNA damage checkpoint protein 1-like [Gigantopelta aegis]
MDLDQTQAIPIDYDDDETDDETSEVEKKPVAYLKLPCQKGVPEKLYSLFEGDNVIGRQEGCDVCIPIKALSKQHACIEIKGESHLIYDKESRNKTRRGKLFLSPSVRYELKHNDSLILADVHCIFQISKELNMAHMSGSETGSESILPVQTTSLTTTNGSTGQGDPPSETVVMEEEEDDENSNDSVDLLQPTQAYSSEIPSAGKMTAQFLFSTRIKDDKGGNNTNSVAVEDTPFPGKKTKGLSTLVLPESESEADDSFLGQLPQTTLLFQDEKDTSGEADLLGAPTQSFLAESDLDENEEDEDITKTKTLLSAATQLCPDTASDSDDEDDTKTKSLLSAATQLCPEVASDSEDEDTTKTKTLLSAATQLCPAVASDSEDAEDQAALYAPTQAFVENSCSDSEDKKSAASKSEKIKLSKTSKGGQEPTVAYDMEVDQVAETQSFLDDGEEPDKAGVRSERVSAQEPEDRGQMPTQVFDENEEDGDEQEDLNHLFTAPTLACDLPDEESDGDNEVTADEATQAFGDNASLVLAVSVNEKDQLDDSTQVIADEDATVAVIGKVEDKPNSSTSDEDATQVFNDVTQAVEEPKTKHKGKILNISSDNDATQTYKIDDDSTLALEPEKRSRGQRSKGTVQVADPDNIDATQVFEMRDDATLAVEEPEGKAKNKNSALANVPSDDDATQVFEMAEDATLAVEEPERKSKGQRSKENVQAFDMADDATLAIEEPTNKATGQKSVENIPSDDDATQVFEMAEDATLAVEEPERKSEGQRSKKNVQAFDMTDDVTLAIEEPTNNGSGQKSVENIPSDDDATQVIEMDEDATLALEEPERKAKGQKSKKKIQVLSEANDDDATQVYQTADDDTQVYQTADDATQVYQTADDATLVVTESEKKPRGRRSKVSTPSLASKHTDQKSKTETMKETVPSDEDATQIIEMEDATFPTEEMEDKNQNVSIDSRGDQSKPSIPADEDATQTFAESNLSVEEPKVTKKTRGRPKKKVVADKKQVASKEDLNKTKQNQTTVDEHTVSAITKNTSISQSQTEKISNRKGLRNAKETLSDSDKVLKKDSHLPAVSIAKGRRGRSRKGNADSTRVNVPANESSTSALVDSEESTLPLDSENMDLETSAKTADEVSSTPTQGDQNLEATQAYGVESESSTNKEATKSKRSSRRQTTGAMTATSSTRAGSRRSVQPEGAVTKKSGKQNKEVEPAPLEATQAYGVDEEDTPEIDMQVESPERSPLKSSLASPDKKRSPSPSPKRVAFKTQKSLEKEKKETMPSPRGRPRKITDADKEEESKGTEEKRRGDVREDKEVRVSRGRKSETSKSEHTLAEVKTKTQNLAIAAFRFQDLEDSEDDLNKSGFSRRTRKPLKALAVGDSDCKQSKDVGGSKASDVGDETRGRRGRSTRAESADKIEVAGKGKKDAKRPKAIDGDVLEGSPSIRTSRRFLSSDDDDLKNKNDEDVNEAVSASAASKGKGKTRSGSARKETVLNTNKNKGKADDATNSELISETSADKKMSKRQRNAVDKSKLEIDIHSKQKVEDTLSGKSTRSQKGRKAIPPETVEKSPIESKPSRRRKASPEVNNNGVELKQTKIDKFASLDSGDMAPPVSKAKTKSKQSSAIVEKSTEVKTTTARASLAPSTVTSDSKSKKDEKIRRASGPAASTPPTPLGKIDQSENTSRKRRGQTDSQSSEAHNTPTKKSKLVAGPTTPSSTRSPKSATPSIRSPSLRQTSLATKPKVMFTGVVDEHGEKIVKDLGGELVTSLLDCTHLVTDKVRRTVKFLGCLARGLPITNPQWLNGCKSAGTFIDCSKFLVSDSAAEKQYKFSLHRSIEQASTRQIFTDYRIHVTKSVRPDPTQMKNILQCAGAQYVPAMPKKLEEKLIVISCDEDKTACKPALNAGIPVVSAEFVLTGILKQELNVKKYPFIYWVFFCCFDEVKSEIEIILQWWCQLLCLSPYYVFALNFISRKL